MPIPHLCLFTPIHATHTCFHPSLAPQVKENKRYAGSEGWTVSECAAKVQCLPCMCGWGGAMLQGSHAPSEHQKPGCPTPSSFCLHACMPHPAACCGTCPPRLTPATAAARCCGRLQVGKDWGNVDILVHSLANGPEVQKPLLETSRRGYLAAMSASSYSFVSLLQVGCAVLGACGLKGGRVGLGWGFVPGKLAREWLTFQLRHFVINPQSTCFTGEHANVLVAIVAPLLPAVFCVTSACVSG